MKICIPTLGERGLSEEVGDHFGRVPTYTLVDMDTGAVEVVENTSHHMGGRGYPPEIIAGTGAGVMLCGGLGRRAIQMFQERGITVHIGARGSVKQALEDWKMGRLQQATDDSACQRHAFRSRDHGNCQK